MTVNFILEALEKRKADWKQWSLLVTHTRREENYLRRGGLSSEACLDQCRSVSDKSFQLKIWTHKESGKMGFSQANLVQGVGVDQQLEALIERANLSTQTQWSFLVPESTGVVRSNLSESELMAKDLMGVSQKLTQELVQAIGQVKEASFNSAELFLSHVVQDLYLSSGFRGQDCKTQIYSEVCFSAEAGEQSNEFLITDMASHWEQVSFKDLCAKSSEGARALLNAAPVSKGIYSSLVDADVLGQLLIDAISHLDGEQAYYGMPFIQKGDAFVPNFAGDEFQLVLDPQLNFALGSATYDEYGTLAKPIELVSDNIVQENLHEQPMATYRNEKTTGRAGNIGLRASGSETLANLRQSQSMLEILQFSGLFSNPQDLSFSSEIRLARLWEPGKPPRYVKGGNFSGNFKENFRKVRFVQDQVFKNLNAMALDCHKAYAGPSHALLNDITVTA